MVFINEKYGVRSMNGPLSDEAAKMICDLMDEKKEERMKEKMFTEEQYKKITDCFDKLRLDYNYGLLNSLLVDKLQQELSGTVNINIYWPKIVAIANPATREEAKEKYVEKEKKFIWKNKKTDDSNDHFYLQKIIGAIITTYSYASAGKLTESEIRDWGYNPDMFDREEVE